MWDIHPTYYRTLFPRYWRKQQRGHVDKQIMAKLARLQTAHRAAGAESRAVQEEVRDLVDHRRELERATPDFERAVLTVRSTVGPTSERDAAHTIAARAAHLQQIEGISEALLDARGRSAECSANYHRAAHLAVRAAKVAQLVGVEAR
jgi:hypothetical protein